MITFIFYLAYAQKCDDMWLVSTKVSKTGKKIQKDGNPLSRSTHATLCRSRSVCHIHCVCHCRCLYHCLYVRDCALVPISPRSRLRAPLLPFRIGRPTSSRTDEPTDRRSHAIRQIETWWLSKRKSTVQTFQGWRTSWDRGWKSLDFCVFFFYFATACFFKISFKYISFFSIRFFSSLFHQIEWVWHGLWLMFTKDNLFMKLSVHFLNRIHKLLTNKKNTWLQTINLINELVFFV